MKQEFHFKTIYFKNFAKADYKNLKTYISHTHDGLLNLKLPCSEIWNIFDYTIKTAINLFVQTSWTYLYKNKSILPKNSHLYKRMKRFYHKWLK